MIKLWERARSHRRGRGATEGGRGATEEGAEPQRRRGATEEGAEPQRRRGATEMCVMCVCVCDATQKIISVSSSIITNKK